MSMNYQQITIDDLFLFEEKYKKDKKNKYMHLKQCIITRKILKRIITHMGIPDKMIENHILNYVGNTIFEIKI